MNKIEQALDKGQDLYDIQDQFTINDWLDYRSSVMRQQKESKYTQLDLILQRELKAIDDCISTIQKINRLKKKA